MGHPSSRNNTRPLADLLRPTEWDEFLGLEHLEGGLVRQLRAGEGRPPSIILWGPPGSGKTTVARLIGASFAAPFVQLSAVLVGVKEVREVVSEAKGGAQPTILFVDEIHRFNKAQQDAFLPHIEDGTIVLIGATTENPSFYLNGALLSRCKVVVLPGLDEGALATLLDRGAKQVGIQLSSEARSLAVRFAAGDARKGLNLIESFHTAHPNHHAIEEGALREFLARDANFFHDRGGEEHYNVVSAFIKSLRGSDPDAALYWGFRMLEGGEDPRFLIRRMMIFASEDIGNADPRALQVAVATADAYDRLGLPEGRIPIAQCITFLASAPKSNRSYLAMHSALGAVKRYARVDVPLHLRNAPTGLMKSLGYGREYDYPHDQREGYVADVTYLPEALKGERFYEPTERGYEKTIRERLAFLRNLKP